MLPAGGAALSWLLVTTLWMPLLNYAQSYNTLVHRTAAQISGPGCIETLGLGQGQIAAFQFYGKLQLIPMQPQPSCPWLLAEPQSDFSPLPDIDLAAWTLKSLIQHPGIEGESVMLFLKQSD